LGSHPGPAAWPVAIHIRTSQSIKYISIDPSGTGPNLRVSATRCELTMRSTDATPDGGPALAVSMPIALSQIVHVSVASRCEPELNRAMADPIAAGAGQQ